MIEILKPQDVNHVHDLKLQHYLDYAFKRLPKDFKYPEYGYFVIIESETELQTNPIQLTHCTIPSLQTHFFDYVELVEEQEGVLEIVLILESDFGISLIIKKELLSEALLNRLQKYKTQG